ncbi:MAG: EamA family transporter [Candidatus Micrarchaeia archaeon]
MYSTIIIASLLAVLSWVGIDSSSKIFIKRLGPEFSVLVVTASGIIPMLVLFFTIGNGGSAAASSMANLPLLVATSMIGGATLFLGFLLIYKSVSNEGIANSFIFVELQPVLLIIFGIFALGEHLGIYQAASMAIVFAGLVLIMVSGRFRINRQLLPTAFGNILWAIYWFAVIIAVLYYHNFILPLLLVRVASAVFAFAYFASINKYPIPKGVGISLAVVSLVFVSGLLDGFGNILFSFVAFHNKVAIGSIMLTMEPILVWLVGLSLYHERITRVQKVGFAIATTGYIVLALL